MQEEYIGKVQESWRGRPSPCTSRVLVQVFLRVSCSPLISTTVPFPPNLACASTPAHRVAGADLWGERCISRGMAGRCHAVTFHYFFSTKGLAQLEALCCFSFPQQWGPDLCPRIMARGCLGPTYLLLRRQGPTVFLKRQHRTWKNGQCFL